MATAIWVVADQWRGHVSDVTFEALAMGRELADAVGGPLEALLLGHEVAGIARSLGKADRVIVVDHPSLAEPMAGAWSDAIAPLVTERAPGAVLIPLTNVTLGVGTCLGAKLGLPVVNFCLDVRVADDGFRATAVMYGGKFQATLAVHQRPAIFGLRPGARMADLGRAARVPPQDLVAPSLPPADVAVTRYLEPDAGDVDLTKQDVLVAVGRGIGSKDHVAAAEAVATALRGVVCGSRPVIDQGWLPLSRQVGKSGLSVRPKLYLAAGISGAPEHVEGMKNSDLIVAINTDPHAPIFDIAHYGIVGDVLDVLPALAEWLTARKG
jgi:electron transfer flavoprotein alpha subunit